MGKNNLVNIYKIVITDCYTFIKNYPGIYYFIHAQIFINGIEVDDNDYENMHLIDSNNIKYIEDMVIKDFWNIIFPKDVSIVHQIEIDLNI